MANEESDGAVRVGGVSLPTWASLYDLADRLKKLSPWSWMAPSDVFGVRLSDCDETGFVSFLEWTGGYRACAVFRGWDAWRNALASFPDEPVSMLETDQLQLVYFDRSLISTVEIEAIRALGRRYRGRHAWPVFRCHRVGYLPWTIDQTEAEWMAGVLRQAYGMAMRVEDDPNLLRTRFPDAFLVRVQDRRSAWCDDWQKLPAPVQKEVLVSMDPEKIARLKNAPLLTRRLQIDLAITPAMLRVGDQARPQTAYVLMIVDAETGRMEAGEIMRAAAGIESMWAQVPDILLQIFLTLGGCPREIEVRSDHMANVVRPLTELFPFRLTRREKLEHLEQARDGLNAFFKGRLL